MTVILLWFFFSIFRVRERERERLSLPTKAITHTQSLVHRYYLLYRTIALIAINNLSI